MRWLGTVPYRDAHALQHGLFQRSADDHLLLLEHPPVYTLGARADLANVLVPPASVGADLVRADRGGDVTFHGPGQLVGYPILDVPGKRAGGMADTVAYVRSVQQVIVETLADLGLPGASCLDRYPGVWLDADGERPRKIAAIGVRLTRGRSMHGFALNVSTDLDWFSHIVPCGIADKAVTSLAAEGIDVPMADVVDALVARAAERWAPGRPVDRADVAWRLRPDDLSPFSRGRVRVPRRGRSVVEGSTTPGSRRCASGDGSPRRGSVTASRSRRASPTGCGCRCGAHRARSGCGRRCETSTS